MRDVSDRTRPGRVRYAGPASCWKGGWQEPHASAEGRAAPLAPMNDEHQPPFPVLLFSARFSARAPPHQGVIRTELILILVAPRYYKNM